MLSGRGVRQHLLSLTLLALIGCGGSVESSPAATDAGGDTVRVERDYADVYKDAVAAEPPKEIDSRQKVTFAIKNTTSSDRWVVLRGMFCTSFSIDGLNLQTGFSCGCECPNPGAPRVETYRRIAPGETYELVWDARALATYEESIDCSMWGPGAMPVKVLRGVLQPAKEGAYTARFAFEEAIPSRCTIAGDEANCAPEYGGYLGSLPGAIASRCESTKIASATFTLPASGDIAVPVALE